MSASRTATINKLHTNASQKVSKQKAGLNASVVPAASVCSELAAQFYGLYERYYADTNQARFLRDLSSKTHVLVLRDAEARLCGFSTIELYEQCIEQRTINVLFSGDTIVERGYWGSSRLATRWLRFAGEVYRAGSAAPLYWLLIVKGHRTYRYLSVFARQYYPHHNATPGAFDVRLRNELGRAKFGDSFDAATGVIQFDRPRGRLRQTVADVPENHRRLAAVDFFLRANRNYRNGDELVCVCKLAPDNLRPMALRYFQSPPE